MITRLRLENFRRHEDTEIHFDADDHLILISGRNGAGKTTILEGIFYALYGEGREGRRGLDRLVRRGAELDGMTVELTFELGGSEYNVVRRREGRSSTAVLYGNGAPLVESPSAVTAEISRLLGMDSQAFRLAVSAHQKELDGLAAHSPTIRRRMVGRLLRLDVVAKARDKARAAYNVTAEVVKTLGRDVDIEELEQAHKAAEARLEAQEKELAEAEKNLAELAAEVKAAAAVSAEWEAVGRAIAAAEAARNAAAARVERAEAGLAGLGTRPEVPEAMGTVEELGDAQLAVERRLAEIAEAEAAAEAARVIAAEADADRGRLKEVLETLAALEAAPGLVEAMEQAEQAQKALADARSVTEEAARQESELAGLIAHLEAKRAHAEELEGICSECGQPVTAEHRAEMLAELDTELEARRSEKTAAEKTRREALIAQSRAELAVKEADEVRTAAAEASLNRSNLEKEEAQIRRRLSVYQPAKTTTIDPAEKSRLEEERKILADNLIAARQAETAKAAAAEWERRRTNLEEELAAARAELEAATAAHTEASKPQPELEARLAAYRELVSRLEEEQELTQALRVEKAVAEGDVKVSLQAIRAEEERASERSKKVEEARLTSLAADILGELSDTLVREVRPALSAAVGEVLAQLSNGRFNKIAITDDYEIQVLDDGEYHELATLSGGERDLVALAVRLGLAALVSERHGHGGIGFLILDECFGSQDEERRRTILDALRSLRTTYQQIFLISHVGGLEDACDRVLEVSLSEDRSTATVREF